MPTTPNYALRFPALTDAPNGPTGIGNLAADVDTKMKAALDAKAFILKGPYVPSSYTGTYEGAGDNTRATILIPDPGWPYRLRVEGRAEVRGLDEFTRADIDARVGSASGSSNQGVVAIACGMASTKYHTAVMGPGPATGTVFTGSKTIYIVSFRRFGGVNYSITDFLPRYEAWVIPATA